MKRLGCKHTKSRLQGHQDCAVCHPRTKAGKAKAKADARREMQNQVKP